MAHLWTAVLIAPALMVVVLALHQLEVSLDRRRRPRGERSRGERPRTHQLPSPSGSLDGRPPSSSDRVPRAVPTLP